MKERVSLLINFIRRLIKLSNKSLNLKALLFCETAGLKKVMLMTSFLCFTGYDISVT